MMLIGAVCTIGGRSRVARRFFVPPAGVGDEFVNLPTELVHHLRSVLRLAVGVEVLLLDGCGGHYQCHLTDLTPQGGRAVIDNRWTETETALPVRLLQGVPKGDRFDLILQKGTELGISAFTPVWSQRSIPAPATGRDEKRLQRWQRIIAEAARQSRRPLLPSCAAPQPLASALATTGEELRLMLWEEGSQPLATALPQNRPRDVALLVGPEGGFSADEATAAVAAGFQPVHLGPRILRSETAGFAVSAILQYVYGDFGVR